MIKDVLSYLYISPRSCGKTSRSICFCVIGIFVGGPSRRCVTVSHLRSDFSLMGGCVLQFGDL